MKDDAAAQRILLVDDNPHGLQARKALLMEQGFDVEIATSGEEGWESFSRQRFDIVVTDFRMQGITGVDLIARVHAADTPARTILLSGFIDCLGLTEKSTGADLVLQKSNREGQDLLRAVRKLMSHAPRRRGPKAQSGGASAAVATGRHAL